MGPGVDRATVGQGQGVKLRVRVSDANRVRVCARVRRKD